MGVTFLQLRTVIGLYSPKVKCNAKLNVDSITTIEKSAILKLIYGLMIVVYVYMICLLLAGAIETASEYSDQIFLMHRSYGSDYN